MNMSNSTGYFDVIQRRNSTRNIIYDISSDGKYASTKYNFIITCYGRHNTNKCVIILKASTCIGKFDPVSDHPTGAAATEE
jgi:hypothetical protein